MTLLYVLALEAEWDDSILVFLGVIKTLTALLLKQNEMSVAGVQTCPSSFDVFSCLLLKTISGMHYKRASYLAFR